MKTPIIVGYDPGTTAALAIINTRGEVLFLKSKRGYKKNEIIDIITERGKPLIVAGDRVPLPKKVEKLASTLGCKTFHPDHSLSTIEKSELVRNYSEKLKDEHEKDALASAFRAYKFYSKLFHKTSSILASLGLSNYYDKIVESIVLGKVDNINNAINQILREKKVKKPEIVEKKIPVQDVSQQIIAKLQNRIRNLEKDVSILKGYNEGLKDKIRKYEESMSYYRSRIERKVDLVSLETLKRNLEKLKNELKEKEFLIQKLKSFRKLELEGYIPILEMEEIRSNIVSELNEDWDLEDRVIFTKNPENAQILNDYRIKALIIPKEPSENLLKKIDFPILTEKDISMEKIKNVLVVKKSELEEKVKEARKLGIIQWLKGHKERKL